MSVLLSDSEIKTLKEIGQLEAYINVTGEIHTIILELKRKGIETPKGFTTLMGYIDDRIKELQ